MSLCARPSICWDGCCLNGGMAAPGKVASVAVAGVVAACTAPTFDGTTLVLCCSHPGLDQIRKSERPPADTRPVSPVLHCIVHHCRTLQASVIPNRAGHPSIVRSSKHCKGPKTAAGAAELEICCWCCFSNEWTVKTILLLAPFFPSFPSCCCCVTENLDL